MIVLISFSVLLLGDLVPSPRKRNQSTAPTGGEKGEAMPYGAGADGNGCDRRAVSDWRNRVLARVQWEALDREEIEIALRDFLKEELCLFDLVLDA